MNDVTTPHQNLVADKKRIPFVVKLGYTAFMAVLVPVYWYHYGPTNFLYFCDIALFLALYAVWTENSRLASAAAVGILIPQLFWCVDFVSEMMGHKLTGMTSYMFDERRSQFLRGLSLFHGWLPFLLIYLVYALGYNPKGLPTWMTLACVACIVAFYFLPPAGAAVPSVNTPLNVNYVFGMDDSKPQEWMHPLAYLVTWMAGLFAVFFVPTHLVLKRLFTKT